ncbi:MAG: hypothetical protein MET45_28000 [Nostoc sp. LLA-1]|nr:hypothetical protein [Cyanocohniella sp. LLY]
MGSGIASLGGKILKNTGKLRTAIAITEKRILLDTNQTYADNSRNGGSILCLT